MSDFWKQVNKLRDAKRISTRQIVDGLFTEFLELKGDRIEVDDQSILTGIAKFNGVPVTVIGTQRDGNITELIQRNFGAVKSAGYRKATRQIKLAEKFNRPIILFINTPGADATLESENKNIARFIAETMMALGQVKVPTVSVVIGEAYSGGALALANTNQILMLSDTLFNVASPEAVNSILKLDKQSTESISYQIQTADKLYELGLIDQIIIQDDNLDKQLSSIDASLKIALEQIDGNNLIEQRIDKQTNFINQWWKNVKN